MGWGDGEAIAPLPLLLRHLCVVLASLQNSTWVCTVPHYWAVAQWGEIFLWSSIHQNFLIFMELLFNFVGSPDQTNKSLIHHFTNYLCTYLHLDLLLCNSSIKFDIEENNNIRTVQSKPSTFAILSFDPGGPKKHLPTAPSSRSECHLTVFCINPIVVYFINGEKYWSSQLSFF